MKTTCLLLLVYLVPLLVMGQECVQQPAAQSPSAKPAPAPGHPLDPNDVAVLTGHAQGSNTRSPYVASTMAYGCTTPYSFGQGERFGFNGFFFPRSRRFGAPFFGAPFGPFFFTGFAGRGH